MTLSTWEAALWNVDWSSREGLKIFKAILLLKNPRGPERGRVSSALWLCCWRIAGDNLCISGSGPVKDSSPSPSRLCQKHRSHYKPGKLPLLFMLIPIQPIIPSFPDFTSLCWSNVFPSLQAQSHQHTLLTLHDPSLWVMLSWGCSPPAWSAWDFSLFLTQRQIQIWPGSFPHKCPCCSLSYTSHPESLLRTDPREAGAAPQQDSFCVCVFANHTSSMTWLAQQRRRDHCSCGAKPPDPVESGECIGTIT